MSAKIRAPGKRARGSRSGRPIMVLLDVLGQRWTLRILWELREEASSFRALQARCDQISPTVLNNRLAQLREMQLVELSPDGYGMTDLGRQLANRLRNLDAWAGTWARKISGVG